MQLRPLNKRLTRHQRERRLDRIARRRVAPVVPTAIHIPASMSAYSAPRRGPISFAPKRRSLFDLTLAHVAAMLGILGGRRRRPDQQPRVGV